jgi:hypothetical protein
MPYTEIPVPAGVLNQWIVVAKNRHTFERVREAGAVLSREVSRLVVCFNVATFTPARRPANLRVRIVDDGHIRGTVFSCERDLRAAGRAAGLGERFERLRRLSGPHVNCFQVRITACAHYDLRLAFHTQGRFECQVAMMVAVRR